MNDFAPEPLHDALADLAETVRPVDLRDRALRTSRRLAIRRAVTTTAAVVALVGVSAAGVSQVLPDHTAPQPGTSHSATPSPEPSSPSAGPAPSASSAPTASSGGLTTTLRTLYYIDFAGTADTGRQPMVSWTPGQATPKRLNIPAAANEAALTANVSPDGRWLSWVDGGNYASLALHLVDLATGKDRVLRDHADPECIEPAWAPDSHRLFIGSPNDPAAPGHGEPAGVLDVISGKFAPLAKQVHGCHVTWAADGTAIGFADGAGKIFVANPDGSGQRTVPGLGDTAHPPYSLDLESVSPQGRRIALWWNDGSRPGGDVARGLNSNAVVDTRTGQKVKLPVSTGLLLQVVFQPDGGMLLRVKGDQHNQLILVAADGTELDRHDEPAVLKTMTMLTT